MTELEHLKSTKAWAEKWLATPADQLPGALTHEKCLTVLEEVEDKLIDHYAITLDANGDWKAVYVH